tara:strand:+ start:3334 stop:4296 length:963 start_codon:yes stop_codon:yes gene_type:complete
MVALALIVVSQAQQWIFITLGMLTLSTGQFLIYTIVCTLSTQNASNRANAQQKLARIRSFGPIAMLSSSLIVILILPYTRYLLLFISTACLILLAAFYTYRFTTWHRPKEHVTNIHFTKHLWSYYLMNFLSGSRSILFRAFVITLLVREFEFNMSNTSGLALASSIAGFIGYRLIASLSTRLSPRLILGSSYTLVGFLFIGFSLIKIPEVLIILYIIDSMIFGVSVVTDSTLKVLLKPSELAGQLSTGQAIFHAAGIILPLISGLIITLTDNLTVVFLFAASLAWLAALTSQKHCSIVDKFENSGTTIDINRAVFNCIQN